MLRSIQFVASIGLIGAVLSTAAIAPAHAVEKVVYIIPGVTDDGDVTNAGVATTFHCINVTNASMDFTVQVRQFAGAILANLKTTIGAKSSRTVSTHFTALFFDDNSLATGAINQGYATIFSSRPTGVICTAMIVDAAATVPTGIALHMQRRTPLQNTLE